MRTRSPTRIARGAGPSTLPGVDYVLLGLVIVAVAALLALAGAGVERAQERRQARLGSIERKLDTVLEHLGIEPDEPLRQQVQDLLAQDKRIQAVKTYRDATDAGLAEAVAAVDRIAARR